MGWGDRIKLRLNEQHKAINYKILDNFVMLGTFAVSFSPTKPDAEYAKGLFKNSWFASVNEFDPTVGTSADPSGAGSLARIAAVKGSNAFMFKDGYISLTNNLSYASRVEYLGWPLGDGENGWNWTGKVGPYAPMRNAIISLKGYLKT